MGHFDDRGGEISFLKRDFSAPPRNDIKLTQYLALLSLDSAFFFCQNEANMKKISAAVLILLLFSNPAFAISSKRQTPAVEVVRNWGASVVNISTERVSLLRKQSFWGNYGGAFDQMYEDYAQQHPGYSAVKLKNIGSGVIVHKEGIIVTNAHVVNMASKIFVRFSNGQTAEGQVILENQKDDLAFIKINPPFELKEVKLADSKDVTPGETVVAIGSPIGLENSVSLGVVSGKGRSFVLPNSRHIFEQLVQTDASINLGSSGGALLNLDGELVGVNLAVVTNAQNIAFAVSSEKIAAGLDVYEAQKSAHLPVKKDEAAHVPVR